MKKETLFTSQPMTIGKHQWRIGVGIYDICGQDHKCTFYEWSREGQQWRSDRDFPTYNGNDTYNGLPRTLSALYEREKPALDFYLHGKPIPPKPQGMFSF